MTVAQPLVKRLCTSSTKTGVTAAPGPHRRHTLFNDKFTIRHVDGKVERRTLKDAKEFGEVFARYFDITPLDSADIELAATRPDHSP
jgi:arylamine N-acetyltransferase